MITGQCLSENAEINKCIEYCPEDGCVSDSAVGLLLGKASVVVAALLYSVL